MKTLFIGLALAIPSILMSQNQKKHEIGLTFRNLDSYGLIYKTGTEESLWRLQTLSTSFSMLNNDQDSIADQQSSFGFSLSAGKEFRKPVTEKLNLVYGGGLTFGYNAQKSEHEKTFASQTEIHKTENRIVTPGIELVFGFNYQVNEHLVFGGEILPYCSYSFIHQKSESPNVADQTNDRERLSAGLSSSSAQLTLAFVF
jgi:hypothetical protein